MRTYFKSSLLIDGKGSLPVHQAAVLVTDGIIEAAGPAAAIPLPEDAVFTDLGDRTLLPGLIDAHVHLIGDPKPGAFFETRQESDDWLLLRACANAQTTLISGLTTVRDCGGRGSIITSLAKAVSEKLISGSNIVSSGVPITTTGGHCYFLGLEAEGNENLQKAVRKLHKTGADFIKVMVTGGGLTPGSNSRASQYSQAELNTIVADAHRLGKRVAGHVHGTEGIERAVNAGFDTLEHVSWLARESDGRDYDSGVVAEILRKDIIVCRTIAGFERVQLEEANVNHKFWPDYEVLRNMVRDGVKLAAGTDSGIDLTPFSGFSRTLETMAGLGGMKNSEVISAATINAAEALGMADQIGTVEKGKRADLIAVTGNPLDDLRVLRKTDYVIQAGRIAVVDGQIIRHSPKE